MNERERNYSLLLLAGGRNSRMGFHKAKLSYGGRTFAQLMIDKARALGISQIYVSGFPIEEPGVTVVWDRYPQRGPLGGINACMKEMETPFCLVLPVDAPKLPVEVLDDLLAYHRTQRRGLQSEQEIPLLWEHGDRKEPLIAIYPVAMADAIGDLIEKGPAPVFRILDRWGYECRRKEIAAEHLLNVNTPQLYQELLREEKPKEEWKMVKKRLEIWKICQENLEKQEDEVAVEAHLEIPLRGGRSLAVTCTPSHVEEMILGRRFLMGDLEEEERRAIPSGNPLKSVRTGEIFQVVKEMFEHPGELFRDTGCAHSCVLLHQGKILCSMEDISRHNALDKVVGYALKNHIPMEECVVFSSGRISEDYLRKVIDAGFRIAVSRAAVTEGAVNLAKKEQITLLGFVRKGSGNLYHIGNVSVTGNEEIR